MLYSHLYTFIKDAGVAKSSMVKSMLEKLEGKHNLSLDDETVIRNTAAITYLTGAETVRRS